MAVTKVKVGGVYLEVGGPRGPQGVQGPQGIQGLQGDPGPAGLAVLDLREIEVDFGTAPTESRTVTVTVADALVTHQVLAVQSGVAPTGRSADENEMDPLLISGRATNGSVVFNIKALDGPVVGKFKINYSLG